MPRAEGEPAARTPVIHVHQERAGGAGGRRGTGRPTSWPMCCRAAVARGARGRRGLDDGGTFRARAGRPLRRGPYLAGGGRRAPRRARGRAQPEPRHPRRPRPRLAAGPHPAHLRLRRPARRLRSFSARRLAAAPGARGLRAGHRARGQLFHAARRRAGRMPAHRSASSWRHPPERHRRARAADRPRARSSPRGGESGIRTSGAAIARSLCAHVLEQQPGTSVRNASRARASLSPKRGASPTSARRGWPCHAASMR